MPTGVYPRTPEMNKAMSESLRGRVFSEEHKRKIGEAGRKRKWTAEQRKKFCAVRKGQKMLPRTIEARIKTGKSQRGNLHWNWQGGKTAKNKRLREAIRQLPEYKAWRDKIFTRDNYTCVQCLKRGSLTLNADHIYPFTKIILDFNIDSIDKALNCCELWDIDNGRTLCLTCHKTTTTYAGHINKQYHPNKVDAA